MVLFLNIVRWLVSFAMALVILVVGMFITAQSLSQKLAPKSLNELSEVQMTVKVALISIKAQILTPIEYPTQFFITYDLYPEVIRMLHVSPGDKIRVFVRNHDAEVLRSNPNQITAYTAGYGIALPDGRFLVDPADVISGRQQFNNELNYARYLVVPVLWFVYMLWSSVRRRRKAAIAT